jgi:Carboxypeptidase regulatory-like domain
MGKRQPDGSTLWYESTARLRTDAAGILTLHSLQPGLTCTVSVRGSFVSSTSEDLAAQQVVLPAPGETREVELVVTARPRDLHGRVVGPDGEPIADARIKLTAEDGETYASSDCDGAFRFLAVYTDTPVRLLATHAGHAPAEHDQIPRERDGEAIEFRLQCGHRVHVTARDGNEALVPVHIAAETGIHDRPEFQCLAPGDYQFADLPARVTFSCDVGGQRFAVEHDARQPEAVLRVPTPAHIVVAAPAGWPAPPPRQGNLTGWATRLDRQQEPFEVRLGPEETCFDRANLLLPGHYRIELIVQRWQDGRAERTPQGPAAEVALRAGEEQQVRLR